MDEFKMFLKNVCIICQLSFQNYAYTANTLASEQDSEISFRIHNSKIMNFINTVAMVYMEKSLNYSNISVDQTPCIVRLWSGAGQDRGFYLDLFYFDPMKDKVTWVVGKFEPTEIGIGKDLLLAKIATFQEARLELSDLKKIVELIEGYRYSIFGLKRVLRGSDPVDGPVLDAPLIYLAVLDGTGMLNLTLDFRKESDVRFAKSLHDRIALLKEGFLKPIRPAKTGGESLNH